MSFKDGIAFIEELIKKECRCNHIALMSGVFNKRDFDRANALGIRIFKKPFRLAEINLWLDQI
jgi:hypothetical protein